MISQQVNRLSIVGKFFHLDKQRIFLRCVTYGPFPQVPDIEKDFADIAAAGFHAVRLYEPPTQELLKAALDHDLLLFVGINWQWQRLFLGGKAQSYWHFALLELRSQLHQWGAHPSVACVFIANEISPDIARWQTYAATRQALDDLIAEGRRLCPHLLYAYASYPSSEYLEPITADFTALNVYLEKEETFAAYLPHLQHVAGDRPLFISEFGLDSLSHGEQRQAELLTQQHHAAKRAGAAGTTIFSWSDNWGSSSGEVTDWNFGLMDRKQEKKLAYQAMTRIDAKQKIEKTKKAASSSAPFFSIIICVFNGAERLRPCLQMLHTLNYTEYEVIIVDDGSSDHIVELMESFPDLHFYARPHLGLSAARNFGASIAKGSIFAYTDDDCVPDVDWLYWLEKAYAEQNCDLCGGPNLAPVPFDEDEAVVAAAPGAPTHVMLTDTQAEHIPGCNLTVTREAFERIGGFDPQFRAAGDDVDFCWRAEQAGLKIGFSAAAFVWHRRRSTYWQYFKQQRGYAKAEALLLAKHPEKFNAKLQSQWKGIVYTGGALAVFLQNHVYAGEMGLSPYQRLTGSVMPLRPLHLSFDNLSTQRKLHHANWIQPFVRAFFRIYEARQLTFIQKTRLLVQLALHQANQLKLHLLNKNTAPAMLKDGVVQTVFSYVSAGAKQDYLAKKRQEGWLASANGTEWELEHPQTGEKILTCLEQINDEYWTLRVCRF